MTSSTSAPPPAISTCPAASRGGTAGYNYQAGQWVVGVEGDIDWSGVRGTNGNRSATAVCNGPVAAGGTGFACATENSWIGTVRGRVGFAVNNVLFFGTAGVAFGDVKGAHHQ